MLKLRWGGGIAEAIPYTNHNGELKIPISGWTNHEGELKQIWPPETFYIYDQTTLEIFRDLVNAGNTSLNGIVTTDITLTGEWASIPTYTNDNSPLYTGTFDGGGHTIIGLTISSGGHFGGFFSRIGSGGIIKNVKLTNTSISSYIWTGGIAGRNYGTIENCTNSGNITGSDNYVGGIVGYNHGTIENCTNSGSVTGSDNYVGGIAGCNNATIKSSTNLAVVSGQRYVGGITSFNTSNTASNLYGTIENCTNSGSVTGSDNYVGGIASNNSSNCTISNSHNSGNITSTGSPGYVGGITASNQGTVSGSTNTGTLTGTTSSFAV